MSLANKAKNKGEELKGQAKEQAGEATGDEDLQAEGEVDEARGNLKQAGEKVKDAFKSWRLGPAPARAPPLRAMRELPDRPAPCLVADAPW